MRGTKTSLLLAALLSAPVVGAGEPFGWKVDPDIRWGADEGEAGISVDIDASAEIQRGMLEVKADGSIPFTLPSAALNDEGLHARLSIGLEHDLDSVVPDLDLSLSADEMARVLQEASSRRFEGSVKGGISATYEADQTLDNRQLAGSAWLGVLNRRSEGRWSVLPSLWVHADIVGVDASKHGERLGVDEELRTRLRAAGSLKRQLPGNLALHLDGRYFHEFHVNEVWQEADLHKAHYIAVALSYSITKPALEYVRGVYVRLSDGRAPPVAEGETSIGVGMLF